MITAGDKSDDAKPVTPTMSRLDWTIADNAKKAIELADLRANALTLTFDETGQLIQMVRARIARRQAFKQGHADLTVTVAKLLNWLNQVAP